MVFVGRRRPVLGLVAVSAVVGSSVRRNTPAQPAPVQQVYSQPQYASAPPPPQQPQYQQPQPQQQYQQQPQQQQQQYQQAAPQQAQYQPQGPSQQHQGQVTQATSSVSHVQAAPLINEQTRSAPDSHYQSQKAAAPSPPSQKTRGPTSASKAILKVLEETVASQRLQGFYQTNQLDYISQVIAENQAVSIIGNEWRLEPAVANDLVKLALYDVVLYYLDDSSTMKSDDGGSKIGDVKYLISSLAYVIGHFNPKGMKLRMINSPLEADNLTNEVVTNDFLSKVKFDGSAPSGKVFEGKVLEPFILGPAREQRLEKPVLVVVVTDRAPGAMVRDKVLRVVKNASEELSRTRYGSNAVSYQVTAIGDDPKLGKFLAVLDSNADINVDTTAGYETEAINHLAANPPLEISPELWLVKLLLGGIDDSYRSDL